MSRVPRLRNLVPEQHSSNCIPMACHRIKTHLREGERKGLEEGRLCVPVNSGSSVTHKCKLVSLLQNASEYLIKGRHCQSQFAKKRL